MAQWVVVITVSIVCLILNLKGEWLIKSIMQMIYDRSPKEKSLTYTPRNVDRTKLKI